MDYSVYIIQDRTKSNEDILKGLAGDTDVATHFKNVAKGAVANAVGADILDTYATTDLLGQNGIAIRGEMINSVSIKPTLVKKEPLVKGSTEVSFTLYTLITVTGNLFAPSLIEMKSETVKNKNMARVMAWASLPQTRSQTAIANDDVMASGDGSKGGQVAEGADYTLTPGIQDGYINNAEDGKAYEKFYYRRVLVTVYSDKDTQFRAIMHDKVFVESYEELYNDKDGNGKFTLVMKCAAASIFDTFVAGPTYKWTALSVADQISSTVQQHTKTTNKIVETVDHIAGTSIAKDVENVTKKIDNINETADSVKDNLNIDNIDDQINTQSETWHPTDVQKAVDQASEYQKAYDKLTPEEKDALKNVPGFDKMSQEDKLDYIEKMQGKIKAADVPDVPDAPTGDSVEDTIAKAAEFKEAYDELTGKQKKILESIPGFEQMSLADKLEYIKKVKDEK